MEPDEPQVAFIVDKFYVKEIMIQRNLAIANIERGSFGSLGEFITYLRDDGIVTIDGVFEDDQFVYINMKLVDAAKEHVEEFYPHLLVQKLLRIQGAIQNRALHNELAKLLPRLGVDHLRELVVSPNRIVSDYAKKRLNAMGVELSPETLEQVKPRRTPYKGIWPPPQWR
jgi:hypothetical protein